MSKAVLISIRPEWVEKILSGEKTLELRKTEPKLETPFKVYIYCTNQKNTILWNARSYIYVDDHNHNAFDRCWNGSVVGEFVCDKIGVIWGGGYLKMPESAFAGSCLNMYQIDTYLDGKDGHFWHISKLEIYDTPKKLSKFSRPFENCIGKVCDEYGCAYCENGGHIKRPPQSWFYVEELA